MWKGRISKVWGVRLTDGKEGRDTVIEYGLLGFMKRVLMMDDREHYWICFTFDEVVVLNGKLLICMNLTSPFF